MEETKKTLKPLKGLNLMDRFLFAEATEDPFIMKSILEIILGKDIMLKHLPQSEKEMRTTPFNRFIKLDVWAWDVEDTVYNTEVQKENTNNLPKRSRYYQSIIDSKLLPPGEINFNKLNSAYIILITSFDLFGEGRYCYTFEQICRESRNLCLNDGATRIFLNTHGIDRTGVSDELVELLHYMEHTTEKVSRQCKSDKIHQIQERIHQIKSSEEIGVKYMQEWEEKIIEKQKARQEGLEEGRKLGHSAGLAEGHSAGLAEGRLELEQTERLYHALIQKNRVKDIERAMQDPEYKKKLYKEFKI